MSSDAFRKPPEAIDLPAEERAIQSAGTIAFAVTLAIFAAAFAVGRLIGLPTELAERLSFAAQASVFVLIWVAAGVTMVSTGRRKSPADIGGSAAGPPSDFIAIRVAFLQNTLEQAVLAVGAYLALAALVGGAYLALIPASVLLFAVGRLLFYRGYRHGARGRALGMTLTITPAILIYLAAVPLILFRLVASLL